MGRGVAGIVELLWSEDEVFVHRGQCHPSLDDREDG